MKLKSSSRLSSEKKARARNAVREDAHPTILKVNQLKKIEHVRGVTF